VNGERALFSISAILVATKPALVSERSIMNQTGHKSVQMVRRYIQDGNLFRENSAGKLGLLSPIHPEVQWRRAALEAR
jgi:hypothetical protein